MKQRTELLINKYLDGISSNREERELESLLRDEEPTDTVRALRIMLEDRNVITSNISRPHTLVKPLRIAMWLAVAAAVAVLLVMTGLQKPRQEQGLQSETKPMAHVAMPHIHEEVRPQGFEASEKGNHPTYNLKSTTSIPQTQPPAPTPPSPMPDEALEAEEDKQAYEELAVRFKSAESENSQQRNELLKYYDNENT